MIVTGAFWPAAFAFVAVTLAMLVLIDFGTYVASRYRERYLEEAKTELDDVLIQIPPTVLAAMERSKIRPGGIWIRTSSSSVLASSR